MSNKNLTYGLIVVGIIAITSLFFPKNASVIEQVATPTFGGVSNYDQLQLNSTTLPELAIGTTSPVINGDAVIDGTGTTSLVMMSSASGKGACLQLESTAGNPVQLYIVGTTVVTTAGTCK